MNVSDVKALDCGKSLSYSNALPSRAVAPAQTGERDTKEHDTSLGVHEDVSSSDFNSKSPWKKNHTVDQMKLFDPNVVFVHRLINSLSFFIWCLSIFLSNLLSTRYLPTLVLPLKKLHYLSFKRMRNLQQLVASIL